MADQAASTTQNATENPAPVKSKKKIFIIAGSFTLLLLMGGGAFFFMTHHVKAEAKDEKHAEPAAELVFYTIPEITVNLNTPDRKRSIFLRMGVKLKVASADVAKSLDNLKPLIIDQFQVYLRQLRPEDLQGSPGIQRLREELLKRVNELSPTIKIQDILFDTLLIQ